MKPIDISELQRRSLSSVKHEDYVAQSLIALLPMIESLEAQYSHLFVHNANVLVITNAVKGPKSKMGIYALVLKSDEIRLHLLASQQISSLALTTFELTINKEKKESDDVLLFLKQLEPIFGDAERGLADVYIRQEAA